MRRRIGCCVHSVVERRHGRCCRRRRPGKGQADFSNGLPSVPCRAALYGPDRGRQLAEVPGQSQGLQAFDGYDLPGPAKQKGHRRRHRVYYGVFFPMISFRIRAAIAALLAGLAGAMMTGAVAETAKPNIVFIMADDLGNADLGYRGGQDQDAQHRQARHRGRPARGSFYGEPVCTPSRAALMTGRYPMRYGLQTLVIFPSHTYGLPTDERTLPQALKDAGYKTLMVGKWHLGHADRKYWPQNRGFDYFYGNVVGEVELFHPRARRRDRLAAQRRLPQGEGLLHRSDRRRRGAADRPAGRQAAVLPLFRVARPACALSGAAGRHRPVQVRRRSAPADLFGDDHRARRSGRPHRRRTRQERVARQHHHPVRQRQRRRDERPLRAAGRRATRSADTEQGGIEQGPEGARLQRAVQRRQGQPARRRRARAGFRQLAGQAQARASSTRRCTWST